MAVYLPPNGCRGPLRLQTPAKINLFLSVSGRRDDGYHEICTLICAIGLFDMVTLTLECGPPEILVRCPHPEVPEDHRNLAWQAANRFFEELEPGIGSCSGRLEIVIDKKIPVGGGLGGGSSDAAAILKSLNGIFDQPFDTRHLERMATMLGADVPFFIQAQPVVATGIGEQLRVYPHLPQYHVLLVYPGWGVSTAAVYKKLNLGLTKCQKQLKNFLFKNEKFKINRHLCNDLERATFSIYPDLENIKKLLIQQGALGAAMSGSGATIFGLFDDKEAARKAELFLQAQRSWCVQVVELLV